MIVSLASLVTLYTMLGGIQAVIWNDVIQFSRDVRRARRHRVDRGVHRDRRRRRKSGTPRTAAGKTALWVPLGDPAATSVWATSPHSSASQ